MKLTSLYPVQRLLERLINVGAMQHKHHPLQACRLLDMLDDRLQRDLCRWTNWIAVGAGAERGEGDAVQVILLSQVETALVSAGKQTWRVVMVPIDRPDRVEHIFCFKVARRCRHC